MDGGKEVAFLNLWPVLPALMCRPPDMQLEVVRELQCKINSVPPPAAPCWLKPLQGRERAGGFHWPGDRVVLFPGEGTELLL